MVQLVFFSQIVYPTSLCLFFKHDIYTYKYILNFDKVFFLSKDKVMLNWKREIKSIVNHSMVIEITTLFTFWMTCSVLQVPTVGNNQNSFRWLRMIFWFCIFESCKATWHTTAKHTQTTMETVPLSMYLLSKHQRMRHNRKRFHTNHKDPLMNRLL